MPVLEKSTVKGRGGLSNIVLTSKLKQNSTQAPRKVEVKKLNLNEALKKSRATKASTSTSTSSGDETLYELDQPIQKKYKILTRLGKGAYGIVWEAEECRTRERVALKKIFDAFRDDTDAQRTYREIIFLQEFGNHPNIISLRNIHRAVNDADIYLVFPLMTCDLHKVIKNAPNLMTGERTRRVLYQILKAVKYLHSANVIHRDLKPANILLDDDFNVKLADFGLARSLKDFDRPTGTDRALEMTEYVATRWYRPPEILLKCSNYSKGADMWAIGCILAEMIRKKALFPGNNSIEQIELVMGIIEEPTWEDIEDLTTDTTSPMIESAVANRRRSLSAIFANESFHTLDLIEQLLVFHPGKRFDVEQSLAHPYLRNERDIREEQTADRPICPPFSDNVQLPRNTYRKSIYDLINAKKIRKFESALLRPPKPAPPIVQKSNTTSTSNLDRKLSLTAAAVISSIKKKQKAISMQNLATETSTSKKPAARNQSETNIPKLTASNPVKYKSQQNQSLIPKKKDTLSTSLGNLAIETPSRQVKAHRSQTLTQVNQNKPRVPFPWEETKGLKKPFAPNSNTNNINMFPTKTNFEKQTPLPTLEMESKVSTDYAKRRALVKTAPRQLARSFLSQNNEDFRNYGHGSLDSLQEENEEVKHVPEKGKRVKEASTARIKELEQLLGTGTHDGYINALETFPSKEDILMEARARTRAATSVPWLTEQLKINDGRGDSAIPQRRREREPSKLFATSYGELDVWSRSRTPEKTKGRQYNNNGPNPLSSRAQKSAPYKPNLVAQKSFWSSHDHDRVSTKPVPGIELEDPSVRIRQSTYFPTRSPSAGGDYLYHTRQGNKGGVPLYGHAAPNMSRTHLPYLQNTGSTNNNSYMKYRSPYESNIRRPDSRPRPQGANSTEYNELRNVYSKLGR